MADEKTYGGFLPFELGRGQEYYKYSDDQIQYYNSGKTAVHYCLMQLKPQRLFVPRYYCPSTKGAIEKAAAEIGAEVLYYHVSRDLSVDIPGMKDDSDKTEFDMCYVRTPDTVDFATDDVNLSDSDAVLLVNYFGVRRPDINSWMKTGAKLIIDNCQAFYSEPVMADNVLNFYSFKKDFGTPDGAFVIGSHVEDYHLDIEDGLSKCDYLLGSLVEGTNKWYKRKKEVDEEIASYKLQASTITRMMIKAIDYEGVKSIRVANFKLYEEALGADNLIKCDEDSVPYLYPLNLGIDIRKALIEKMIFIPTLWADTLEDKFEGSDEYLLSKNTLFMPIDQRYDEKDIKYIIDIVNSIIKSKI
ncbi:MAG: hypothetical protein K6G87_17460 [Butyrivibrio sp.]|uniref:hypothetical protein n=1 Tax=Butyrivibrio sp. TaxID=28121 RepID=UPI0025E77A07|nr:hypothetical protein [Butyrivibrio sp.]MCR5773015.1 hypothetical protein [Butyrivibrio sp.]